MAMTVDEKQQLADMKHEVDTMATQLAAITKKLDSIFSLLKGIAIGIAIGGIIFGFLQIKDLISIAK